MLKRIIKKIKTSSILNFLCKNLAYCLVRALIATYRLRVTYGEGITQPLLSNSGVFYFWHQQIIAGMTFFYKKRATGYCVVSPSNDGKFAGFVCQKLGFSVLYGSSSKAAVSLVRNALHVLKSQRQLCIVGDGSRGPAFQVQQGVRYLASKAQVPLIFVECSSSWHLTFSKSWDKFQIPLPFSKVYVFVHAPMSVHDVADS